MKRREWLLAAAAVAATPLLHAQALRLRRVALGIPGAPDTAIGAPGIVKKRLEELGWVEGRTIEYAIGYAYDDASRWEPMAVELLAQKPDVLLMVFGSMALAAMKHTKDVPIVFAATSNPEKAGLVASLAKPGGNVTGVSTRELELLGKRIELMREITPGLRRIAVLVNSNAPVISDSYVGNYTEHARRLGIEVKAYDAKSAAELRPAFDRMRRDRMQGLLTVADTFQFRVREELAAQAARVRLTAVHVGSEFVEAGGLSSFGTNRPDQLRRAADYVDKILRGAKPADLPVQEPTNFQLAINLKAAREQGIKFPQSILVRADQVIE